ncbi:MAG: tRNA pseudouridine(55) synthase TruB [Nocardioides sp.]|uniref:tRNA pseudouridine(55) synthase TruB n=1 Tax=Nocardioides sp. TaxID=35761 RepID=UPI0039E58762
MAESGLVVLDKPAGLTSHDVVARVRRLAGTRKVGHAGTLDPMATGVLVVGVERATRLLGHLMLTEKAYDATVRLGRGTTTDDAEGEPLESAPAVGARIAALDETRIRAAFATQVGEIEQVPTAVSAIKVDGKRAYQRVRAGESVELPARPVTIHELTVHDIRAGRAGQAGQAGPDGPDGPAKGLAVVDVDISLRCSSGTYVRAIARDVGTALGVGGHLIALRRTAVGPYRLAEAVSLDELAERYRVLPLAEAARAAFPGRVLTAAEAEDVRHGRRLRAPLAGLTALFDPEGDFLALYEPSGRDAKAVAVFV